MLNNPFLSGFSTGRGSDSESDGPPHRKMPDVRKDDMSVRRTSVTELRTPLPFNQYLPNKSNHSGYMPAPLRKKMNDKDEGSRKSWSTATSPVGGDRPCRWALQVMSCVRIRFIQRLPLENVILTSKWHSFNCWFILSHTVWKGVVDGGKICFFILLQSETLVVTGLVQVTKNLQTFLSVCVCVSLRILHTFLMHVLFCFSSIFFLFLYLHLTCDPPFPHIHDDCCVMSFPPDVTLTRFPVCVCVWMGDVFSKSNS